jgi:signal transduction histidine kinase
MYMSKILEKKLVGRALMGYWKQFAGWAIALRDKWQDPFIRSEINVVTLQISFALLLLIVTYEFLNYFYEETLRTILSGLVKNIINASPQGGDNLVNSLEIAKSKNFTLLSIILGILTTVFAFLVAKITLGPAKNALDSQKRFISDIAHELRTPLSIIKTNNEVVLMEEDIDVRMREIIESNIEELDRMSDIINNILSFNNLVRPERIKFSNVDLGPIIDTAVSKLHDLADKKGLEINVDKIKPYVVWGNVVALEQIVINLLKNAINYTNKGHVAIKIRPDYYGNVVLQVEDTGTGITKKDLMHIFVPFYRAEKSRSRGLGSSGLGLTIVSELVKMHSGRITIKSAENKGTVAIVTLPYGKDLEPEINDNHSSLDEASIDFLEKK